MNKITTILSCLLIVTNCLGQSAKDTSFCDRSWCKFPKDHPYHFNPYYNGHLCENFNPQQIDFSKEYFELQTKQYSNKTDQLQKFLKFNYCSIWLSGIKQQNGVIGLNYQRIQIHIDKVTKNKTKSDTYIITGKSKVKDNICNFSGELKLLKLFLIGCSDTTIEKCGQLFGSYTLYEDSLHNHCGVFKGIMECSVRLDSTGKRMLLGDCCGDDNYWNRTFIGTWTEYKTGNVKKCIWGDYRLPFVFDFMCGDGEMRACDKYAMYGWQTFNDNSEYMTVNEKWELKDKWWLRK